MVLALATLGVLIDSATQDEDCEIRHTIGRYLENGPVVAATLYPHPVALVSYSGGQAAFPPQGEGAVTAVEITENHEIVMAQMDASISILPLAGMAPPRRIKIPEIVVCLMSTPRRSVTSSSSSAAKECRLLFCGTLSNKLLVVDLDQEVETSYIHLPHDGPVLDLKLLERSRGVDTFYPPSTNKPQLTPPGWLFADQGGTCFCIDLADMTVEKIEPKNADGNPVVGTIPVRALYSTCGVGPVFGLVEGGYSESRPSSPREGISPKISASNPPKISSNTSVLHLYAPSQPQSRPLVSIPLVYCEKEGEKLTDVALVADGGLVLCCYSTTFGAGESTYTCDKKMNEMTSNSDPTRKFSRLILQTALGQGHNMIVQEFPIEDKVHHLVSLRPQGGQDMFFRDNNNHNVNASSTFGHDNDDWNVVALVATLREVYSVKMSLAHLSIVLEALAIDLIETDNFVIVVKLCNALGFDFDEIVLGAGKQALEDCIATKSQPGRAPQQEHSQEHSRRQYLYTKKKEECVHLVSFSTGLKIWGERRNAIPLRDLHDAFGCLSQWPLDSRIIDELCAHREYIYKLFSEHWNMVIPRAAAAGSEEKENRSGGVESHKDEGEEDTTDTAAHVFAGRQPARV